MLQGTVMISLLQPPPEVFDLFDDVLLLSEGQVRPARHDDCIHSAKTRGPALQRRLQGTCVLPHKPFDAAALVL